MFEKLVIHRSLKEDFNLPDWTPNKETFQAPAPLIPMHNKPFGERGNKNENFIQDKKAFLGVNKI